MKNLFLLIIFINTLYSFEYNQKFSTLSKKFCIDVAKSNETLCLSYKLKYPYDFNLKNKKLKQIINQKIQNYVKKFKALNPKGELLEELKGTKADFGGDWYENMSISIYSILPNSFTLLEDSDSFLGGAHGSYYSAFYNYKHNGKKLKLSDIVNDINSFTKEAEKFYKEYYNIKKDKKLSDIDWFEDRFVLAKEFALNRNGIYFLYNIYEIKSYASGQTELLIPYSRVKKYINKKFWPNDTNKKVYILDKNTKLFITKLPKKQLQLTLKIKAPINSKRAWVSIAFPKIYAKNGVLLKDSKGFKNLSIYPKGSKIYNNMLKKAIPSQYLLVEGYTKNWQKDTPKSISLKIKTKSKGFIDIRAVFDKTKIPQYQGVIGQQGFYNFRVYYQF